MQAVPSGSRQVHQTSSFRHRSTYVENAEAICTDIMRVTSHTFGQIGANFPLQGQPTAKQLITDNKARQNIDPPRNVDAAYQTTTP
jgi:hypothetical protein